MSTDCVYKYQSQEDKFYKIAFKVMENLKVQVDLFKILNGDPTTLFYLSKERAEFLLSESGFNGSLMTSGRIIEYIFHLCGDDSKCLSLAKSAVDYAFLESMRIFSSKMPFVSYESVSMVIDEINKQLLNKY